MFLLRGRIGQSILCFILVGYLFAGFIGVSHIGMGQEMNGQTVGCPFMPGVVICNMTPMQHVAAAQTMFTALPAQNDLAVLLFAFLSLVIGFLPFLRRASAQPRVTTASSTSERDEYVPTHTALQELFSRGVLNPKLF